MGRPTARVERRAMQSSSATSAWCDERSGQATRPRPCLGALGPHEKGGRLHYGGGLGLLPSGIPIRADLARPPPSSLQMAAPSIKTMEIHFDSKHPKETFDAARCTNKIAANGGVTTSGVAVKVRPARDFVGYEARVAPYCMCACGAVVLTAACLAITGLNPPEQQPEAAREKVDFTSKQAATRTAKT